MPLYKGVLNAALLAATTIMPPHFAFGQQPTLYVGTYTGPQSQGIYRCTIDEATGQLSAPMLVAKANNPSFVALSQNGKNLFAVCESKENSLNAWKIEADGTLLPLNSQPSGGAGVCHLSIDSKAKTALVANYGGGSIASFPISVDGSLGESAGLQQFVGSGPDTRRQEKPHAHAVYVDPTDHFVYSCDLGTDKVMIFKLGRDSTLTPADPPFATVAPGSGPRHLTFGPAGYAYADNEMAITVTAFKRNIQTGELTEIQTTPTIPEDAPREGVTTAEIFAHPSGRWLYVSNRGRNTIASFAIGNDGRLTWLGETPTPNEPRGFGISPDGKWMVVGGQKSNQLTAYKIDPATGKLSPSGQTVEIGAPVCVVFAPDSQ